MTRVDWVIAAGPKRDAMRQEPWTVDLLIDYHRKLRAMGSESEGLYTMLRVHATGLFGIGLDRVWVTPADEGRSRSRCGRWPKTENNIHWKYGDGEGGEAAKIDSLLEKKNVVDG